MLGHFSTLRTKNQILCGSTPRNLAAEAKAVHVVFNNNNLDYAPRAAMRLRKALGQSVAGQSSQAELF